jgi:acyl phosphate:glycerol-3-phosphate acyltransferase
LLPLLTHTSTILPGCLIAAAYLCGSLPAGVWAARRAGVDVRRRGSGNIGATNVARTAGTRAALLTLGADIGKGLVPVLVARALAMSPWTTAGVGFAAILGHVASVFLRFSGGKGVATACGVFLGIAPLALAVSLAVFAAIAVTTRYVSLASVVAVLVLSAASVVIGYDTATCSATAAAAAVIVLRHRDNLLRLLHGREPRFQMRR